jgi:hypothetical protein
MLESSTATDNTSHTVLINTTTPINLTGKLLITFFVTDGAPTFTWPAGWTVFGSQVNGVETKIEAAYRIADGTEGTTINISTSAAEEAVAHAYIISHHNSSTNPPEIAFATGTSAAPNPPNLAPTTGAGDYLWIEAFGADDDDEIIPYESTGYWGNITFTHQSSSTTTSCMIASAINRTSASSENPDAMAMAASEEWVACTVAVGYGTEGIGRHPLVVNTNTSFEGTATTSHTVNLPPSITVGQLLVVMFTTDGAPTFTWPGGWTSVIADTANGVATKTGVRYRVADGTETPTISITTSASVESAHQSVSIIEFDTSLPIEGTVATGTSDEPDPPLITPTGGSKDYLFIFGWGADDDDEIVPFHKFVFNTLNQVQSSSNATSCMNAACWQAWSTPSVNVNASGAHNLDMTLSEEWVCFALAVQAAPATIELGTIASAESVNTLVLMQQSPGNLERVDIISKTLLKAVFSVNVKNNYLLTLIDNYVINNGLEVLQVLPTIGPSVDHVLLRTNEPILGTNYTLTVENFTTTEGISISLGNNSQDFTSRETKLDSMKSQLSSMYNMEEDSTLYNILAAISIEDDLIGGSRNDDL